ncbi:Aerobic respiration control protein arcA [Vibrio cholerae]|nr:Aerobic respiration control protein arcA [Vibrio cholerae]
MVIATSCHVLSSVLCCTFCENPGKIQTRADLLKKMTGRELKPHDRTVDVTIRRIRKHFESVSGTPEIIATIHGEGYRFCGDLED